MFAAPPRSGEISGPTRTLGINGLRIKFPEFTLALPSIELPSFTRFRRGAQMRLDQANAPYMENPYYGDALLARQLQQQRLREAIEEEQRAARDRGVDCVDRPGAKSVEEERSCEERIRALQNQLQQLQNCLDAVQDQLSANPRPPLPPADFPPSLRKMPPADAAGFIQRSSYEAVEPQFMPAGVRARRLPTPMSQTGPSPILRRLPFAVKG
jgi:hypothetical protein